MRSFLRGVLPASGLAAAATARATAETAPEGAANGLADAEPTAAGGTDAARLLAELLADEQAREALIARLLADADDAGLVPDPETIPILQISTARQIAEYTREMAEAIAAFARSVLRSTDDVLGVFTGERMVNWLEVQDAVTSLALVAAVSLGLFLALSMLGQRVLEALAARSTTGSIGWAQALGRLVAVTTVDAAAVVIAWGAGHAVALATGIPGTMDVRQSLFLNAFLLIETSKLALRILMVPHHGKLRLLPMGDETAAYWYFWASRLISLLGYGILLAVPMVNAAVSFTVGRSLTLLILLTALLTAILIVLQNRKPVRNALRARYERDPDDTLGRLAAGFGAIWHILAIGYLLALFLIWTASPRTALPFMLAATAQSAGAVVLGVIASVILSRAIAGGLRVPADVQRRLPLLEARLNAFVPNILKLMRLIVAAVVAVAVAQAWQIFDALGWLASEAGSDVIARLISAAVVLFVALVLWLGVSSFVEYRLHPDLGTPPSPREQTLLMLFRNAFTVVLSVIAVMLTLSQLGMNIAPLIAGAGVVGLAVGFGAQRLVQDVITGAFIQIENAMNRGDVVTAGGTTGVVEKLTIRSVGLRDLSGTYHVIPFSSVDSVSNFMKGFGYHVADVGVAYREDVAEVKRLMQEAFDRLLATEHGASIIGPFEMFGVTELADSAVVVRGRIKTLPGQQWAVGREYTEIVKRVLDEAGIEIPFPHMTLYMGQNKDGSAPPLALRQTIERRARLRAAAGADEATPGAPALPGTKAEDVAPAPEQASAEQAPAPDATPEPPAAADGGAPMRFRHDD